MKPVGFMQLRMILFQSVKKTPKVKDTLCYLEKKNVTLQRF